MSKREGYNAYIASFYKSREKDATATCENRTILKGELTYCSRMGVIKPDKL